MSAVLNCELWREGRLTADLPRQSSTFLPSSPSYPHHGQAVSHHSRFLIEPWNSSFLAFRRRGSVYCATKACVTSLSDVLRMELAGFNVGVMCVFPGAIRSNIGSKNAAAFSQAPESNYGNVTDQVIKRAQWSQCPSSTPADKLAQEIVDAALSSRPPAYLSAGYRATRAWWSFYLPYWLKDYFWGSQFGTASVGKW